jgi:hypothetical protein
MNALLGRLLFPAGAAGNHVRWLLSLDDQFPNPFGLTSVEQKADFIKTKVYNSTRTWNTWLGKEWEFRPALDKILIVDHTPSPPPPGEKRLYLETLDPTLPALHYFHINLGLMAKTPDQFVEVIKIFNSNCDIIKSKNLPETKVIVCDKLFQPVLDRETYLQLVDFYGFADNYDTAKQIHSLYHTCRVNSARDFCNWFESDKFKNYFDALQALGNSQ